MRIRPTEAMVPSSSPVAAPAHTPAKTKPSATEASSFSKVLHRLGSEIDRGEATVHKAIGGASTSDPAALLALQAGIYRYVEAVDLASKLVDRAAGAVKTTLQSQ